MVEGLVHSGGEILLYGPEYELPPLQQDRRAVSIAVEANLVYYKSYGSFSPKLWLAKYAMQYRYRLSDGRLETSIGSLGLKSYARYA